MRPQSPLSGSSPRVAKPTRPIPGSRQGQLVLSLTLPTKVPSGSLGRIGSLKGTSDKSLFPMALGSYGHRITHQLRPINMNGRSILSETSIHKIFNINDSERSSGCAIRSRLHGPRIGANKGHHT